MMQLFMALLWILHELLALTMFWNLPALHLHEQLESAESNCESTQQVNVFESQPAPVNEDIMARECTIIPEEPANIMPSAAHRISQNAPEHRVNVSGRSSLTVSNEVIEEAEELIHSDVRGSSVIPRTVIDRNSVQNLSWPCDALSPVCLTNSDSFLQHHWHSHGTVKHALNAGKPGTVTEGSSSGLGSADMPLITRELCSPSEKIELSSKSLSWRYYYDEFIREETVAILGTVFVALFNQVTMETVLTPLTQRLLHWDELQNSILFCIAGIEVFLVFAAVRFLSRTLSDRCLLIIGSFFQAVAIAFLLLFIPRATDENMKINLAAILLALFFDFLGMPLVGVASNSLFSKVTHQEAQGLAQGIWRIFAQFGQILGPLWAGTMLCQPYYMFGIMLGVNFLFMFLLLLSFDRLKPVEQTQLLVQTSIPTGVLEKKPLLS